MSWYRWDNQDLVIQVKVVPRASRDQFAELLGDAVKVQITAPPVDGKANKHLCKFIAKALGVAASKVAIEAGETSRNKRIRIESPTKLDALPLDNGQGA